MQLAESTDVGPDPTPIILTCVFTPIAIVVVALRFYSRHMKGANLMMDDWIILPALLFAVAQAAILFANALAGDLGKHQPLDYSGKAIPSPKLELFQKFEYASFLTFVPALLFAKLSLLHLYNRIFQVQSAFRIAIWTTYGINVAWGIAFFIGYVFKCWPISDYWMTANGAGQCLPYTYHYAFAFSNVILDVIILVMPLPVVWSLNMAWRQKLAVSGIFLLGTVVVALSIAKATTFFFVLQRVQWDNEIMLHEASLFYLSVPEALVAVISACLPTLRPLFRKLSAPISSQMSRTGKSASAAAANVINRVDITSRGIPTRELQRDCASPAGKGPGRDRGLNVRRESMAGGVMWEWYTRRSDELAQDAGFVDWKRDSQWVPEEDEKHFSNSTGPTDDLERGLAELRRDTSRASTNRTSSAERSPASLTRSPVQPVDLTVGRDETLSPPRMNHVASQMRQRPDGAEEVPLFMSIPRTRPQ